MKLTPLPDWDENTRLLSHPIVKKYVAYRLDPTSPWADDDEALAALQLGFAALQLYGVYSPYTHTSLPPNLFAVDHLLPQSTEGMSAKQRAELKNLEADLIAAAHEGPWKALKLACVAHRMLHPITFDALEALLELQAVLESEYARGPCPADDFKDRCEKQFAQYVQDVLIYLNLLSGEGFDDSDPSLQDVPAPTDARPRLTLVRRDGDTGASG